jgi:hypothetical protein
MRLYHFASLFLIYIYKGRDNDRLCNDIYTSYVTAISNSLYGFVPYHTKS